MAAQCFSDKKDTALATWAGFLAGILADADLFIRSSDDPLLSIEYHRHFTHSLFFVPLGGFIAAVLIWWLLKKKPSFSKLCMFTLLGYATHGLLDACTSYGTRLFWPFSDQRVAWDTIAIIDPVFSGGVGLMVALAYFRKNPLAARIGLAFALVYLLAGALQRDRATDGLLELAKTRGHAVERVTAKPTLFNLILWRGIYESEGRFHMDAVRVGIFSGVTVYPGESVEKFRPHEAFPTLAKDSTLYRDIRRFAHFSEGYMALRLGRPNIVGDMRYAALPHQTKPLWGIEIDINAKNRHVPFINFHKMDKETWNIFWLMLRGK